MKKLIPFFLLSALSLTAYESMEDRLEILEKEMHEISAVNPQDTTGAGFVTARPETVGNNWFITFDVIYWHPKMGGTEYGIATIPFISESFGRTRFDFRSHNGKLKENDFSWDLGLKAGVGYKTPHDSWDVYARYTWFQSNSSASCFKNPPSTVFTLRSVAGRPSKWAKSHVDIDYNNIDLELARSYFLSNQLSIRPHFDLKATWLDLAQNITYNHAKFTEFDDDDVDLDRKIYDSSKMFGLGPKAGIDSNLFLGYGFSLTGEIAGSILYSYYKVRHKEKHPLMIDDDFVEGGTQYTIRDKMHRFTPFVQMFLGMVWETFLNDKKQHLSFKGGYEIQYFWRVNQMLKTESQATSDITDKTRLYRNYFDPISEDLMFYGITGSVRLDF